MRTRDVGFVALLVLNGHRWTHVYAVTPTRVEFMFPDEPSVFALERDYQQDRVQVSPRAFLRQYKELMAEVRKANGSSRPTSTRLREENAVHARADAPQTHS